MKIKDSNRMTRLRSAYAFTLVEAVIAVLIVAILFTSLYAGITYSFATMALSRENLRATQIILEKMETLRLYNWDQINTAGFVPTNFSDVYNPNSTNNAGTTYSGTLTIGGSEFSESYTNELRKVTITLEWTSNNVLRQRGLETYVASDGLQTYIY